MIGDMQEAATIAEFGIDHDDNTYEVLAPDGWEFIGDGAYRYAFRSPSGVVYKIENEDGEYEAHNHREYENIQRCNQIPVQGWRVPEASYFEIPRQSGAVTRVIAMEYVPGPDDTLCRKSFQYSSYNMARGIQYECSCGSPGGECVAERWQQIKDAWGILDVHTGNVRVEADGTRVLIDVADVSDSY